MGTARGDASEGGEVMDERVRRSRAAVLAATSDLLFERGYSGVSVDEVARRSGVAKTTIYRHWPSRTDLLRDACASIGTPQTAPDLGSLRADIAALMGALAEALTTARWTAVLPSIVDAGERDPDMAEMYRRLQQGYSSPFEAAIRRGIDRGELPADTDVAALAAALIGPLFFRRWFAREPLTEGFVREIVRIVVG
ncbi:TetR/AcrR family transcriptional regulator [Pleomorphomonas sp. NRK KF1]|uniref:TetR/AcrR family transcriptional regulator n=1 Tax=Pleomorphomonas sp. NRK KF1 TaxID=2943000 RepID=UPI002043ED96|nr:TetR/AcrR family transcriptional regulator [Pleomorphomonas sp. NRK KF1]MCM5554149.1 TetR/AcrR family transcriptional regulator [Pleomorphomonas sp. NRK KF1]